MGRPRRRVTGVLKENAMRNDNYEKDDMGKKKHTYQVMTQSTKRTTTISVNLGIMRKLKGHIEYLWCKFRKVGEASKYPYF